MPQTPTQRLADHLLGEPLEKWIRRRRPVRKTWRQLASELAAATDGAVDVTPQTLLNWFPDPDDDDEPAPAPTTSTAAAS